MKVSVITVCYNRVATIENSIKSVLEQDYANVEYIVIDGGSNDGTQGVIEKYTDQIDHYISEPDKGMYDAINKGFKLASGDIIGLLHSDDEFYENSTISKIVEAIKRDKSLDGVYGDGLYVSNDANESIVRRKIGGSFDRSKIKKGWLPLHTTVFLKIASLNDGYYNLDFKIASDTDFLLRYLYQHNLKLGYLDTYVTKMRVGGFSTSFKHAVKVYKEDWIIYKRNGLNPLQSVLQKKFLALSQYIKK